ncbi:MAG TPA: acetyl-CoA carboxylase biotin carboxylase subunit [Streptosporangiaceae bacterium]
MDPTPEVAKPLRRVLVANRGEIAVRVIRACHLLGSEAVAVYSEADADTAHVRKADDARLIGPPQAAKSYLDIDALIGAAKDAGADAVHPGYGFLSENAGFARAVTSAGLTFVGPSASAIAAMGDKARARVLAQEAGVPLVPGSGLVETEDDAVAAAGRVGYPVLVKAAAGGGGRGIRPAADEAELRSVIPAAQREAAASFGNDAIYLERCVTRARHVEVQVLADAHGNVVHCYERDCSLQRRRQKLFEEAPAPGLAPGLRDQMTAAAIRLARQVGYTGAGTVEFLVDGDRFYFMEMNTRIQVEHPVTELITGLDLVAEQLLVAAGQPLSVGQQDIAVRGHAVECRINAEDPAKRFLPRPGTVTTLELPGGPGVRIDHALLPGGAVTPFYDSLVAKLCAWGTTRSQALGRAGQALAELEIGGLTTTAPLHRRLLDVPDVRSGDYHTAWLEEFLA